MITLGTRHSISITNVGKWDTTDCKSYWIESIPNRKNMAISFSWRTARLFNNRTACFEPIASIVWIEPTSFRASWLGVTYFKCFRFIFFFISRVFACFMTVRIKLLLSGPGFISIYRIYRLWWWWFKLIININIWLLICNTYYRKMFNTYNLYHQGL